MSIFIGGSGSIEVNEKDAGGIETLINNTEPSSIELYRMMLTDEFKPIGSGILLKYPGVKKAVKVVNGLINKINYESDSRVVGKFKIKRRSAITGFTDSFVIIERVEE